MDAKDYTQPRENTMKKLIYLLITISLVSIILLVSGADVNHGYGPGYVYEPYGYNDDNYYEYE